jgi:hypothetical protein
MNRTAPVLAASFLFVPVCSAAQDQGQVLASHPVATVVARPLSDYPVATVDAAVRWTQSYLEWEEWYAQWGNRREPGWFTSRGRKARPAPPAWLAGECVGFQGTDGPMADACQALARWKLDESSAVVAQRIAQTRVSHERETRSTWWSHIHLDALWPVTQIGSSAFGLAGAHATMKITKRVGIFLGPGAMLMRLPSITGSARWSTATDWGFSYRLTSLRLPAIHRPATLHLNMAKVWVLGETNLRLPGEMYLVGFSLTFKPAAETTR